jgi:hypothetical protein
MKTPKQRVFDITLLAIADLMKFISGAIPVLILSIFYQTQSQASLIFSDVGVTDSTLTFTIDGDMSGYVTPSSYIARFGITYTPGLLTYDDFRTNTWSNDIFDDRSWDRTGGTGHPLTQAPPDYTWSALSTSLLGARATSRLVVLGLGPRAFDKSITDWTIDFIWGWPNSTNPGTTTNLYSCDYGDNCSSAGTQISVPEPSVLLLFLAGMLGLGIVRRCGA